ALGFLTRWAGLVMAFNFVVAVALTWAGSDFRALFPALAMIAVSLVLATRGAGLYSLDAQLERRRWHPSPGRAKARRAERGEDEGLAPSPERPKPLTFPLADASGFPSPSGRGNPIAVEAERHAARRLGHADRPRRHVLGLEH